MQVIKQQKSRVPPPLVLNKHCPECLFRARCRRAAVEKDDLSLLANMNAKERKKLNDKGIFTVTQLSYTFRPRRRRRFKGSQTFKHEPALKALAIRKDLIHVIGTPTFNIPDGMAFLDVEGVPDRDFYYLIGLGIGRETNTFSILSGRIRHLMNERCGRHASTSLGCFRTPAYTTMGATKHFS